MLAKSPDPPNTKKGTKLLVFGSLVNSSGNRGFIFCLTPRTFMHALLQEVRVEGLGLGLRAWGI